MRDIVVLEVAGYEGSVLELSMESPKEQSYIMGYSKGFKIQSVRTFKATDIHYGAFLELFDCYYGFNFTGSSGGPLVNKKGEVEGVFANMIASPFTDCPFLLARRLDFLTEEMQNNQINDSIEKVKEFMLLEQDKTIELATDGDWNARFELLFTEEFPPDFSVEFEKAIMSDNALIQYYLIDITMRSYIIGGIYDTFQDIEMIDEKITSSKPQDLLPVTWYSKGFVAYYEDADLKKACEFWDKARQTGHPFVFSDFVIAPSQGDIISCKF